MKLGRYGYIGILVALALVVFTGFPAKVSSAAGNVTKIVESALDTKIGDKQNRLALVFMAAWCAPCIDELPTLNTLHKKYKDQGLEIIGISIDLDGPDAMQPVVSALKIDFPVYWYGEKAVEKFALFAIPMMLLVKKGEIVERIHGRRPDSFLDEKFRSLLK
jgi:thiol-disulfide isomerase/thioredoxin